ncbi:MULTISPECIES: phospholipase D family protein [Vitreoscilla]|uniref:Phospholipase D family protein n=1 Tax=Vitreoscilla stercoraria TaxID=61 RepID=A0ABY4E9T4_VITST|nr:MULTISPECIES: phospholipase D family protein [Vitreoscilla]UOO92516.1 phospholipase D family protein [Vitreoscilla stercoraria]
MKKWLQLALKYLFRLILVIFVIIGVSMLGCSLPSLQGRSVSKSLSVEEINLTYLGQSVGSEQKRHPDLAGIYLLPDPRLAFAARTILAQDAEKTLDIQYYIWKKDTTGMLLLHALYEAADRGVKVRLLLDDNGTNGLDTELMALNAHPNIEVRLFNPFLFRPFKQVGFLTDFMRSNRRMHNKSFIADNSISVLGGRNVGDEYFGATDGVLFADLDNLVSGDLVQMVSKSFDEYWDSQSAYPIDLIVEPITQAEHDLVLVSLLQAQASPEAVRYIQAKEELGDLDEILKNQTLWHWVPTQFVVDPASKGLGIYDKEELILHSIAKTLGEPEHSLDIVSPYFVPTNSGTDYFVNLARQGKQVRILTNSMVATDVLAVHSGYAKHRKRLVENGVLLYEMKPEIGSKNINNVGFLGSSGSSLHAKTFSADMNRVFIGSFNFDPRSAKLNTEMGIVSDDAQLARDLDDIFKAEVPQSAWLVVKNPDADKLEWHDGKTGEILHQEPLSKWYQRWVVTVLGWLPIDWLL